MYLHVGKDYMLNENSIIGIFDIQVIKQTKEYEQLYKKIEKDVIDISDGTQKTFILVKNEKIKGYITNISSVTLKNRL